uniref:LIMR family protein n=1 Tax=Mucochytrium quahogii TaxID=96639 RepID=A0A7S2RLI5_9STRA|mmetsp:Transcript_5165/g.7870  ORF Transcript_5165/g.7870 Transcript_5165/m.7870 type:complete len:569 (+) Transcript_5165:248-1954(+)|eukprot:CAMPEP_0203753850 /NCGR_PEP_ID=MMETSP0098-20131031/7548_1 /ASSEMBLY_ACC=CAM_ASM_000208 /TAXON_ID=96639 /ORGANISM=" , Strain NY0313808BC1" /LENGTH=568 /DNA_ID=CAMNT_0050644625 /DNA_START=263 /DNA_END=1969 /DNA_ORIENTATION=+
MTSSVWLIVLAVVIPLIALGFCYYMLVYFQHPDDRNTAYFPKAVVVFGLLIAVCTVLLIPFDVANQGGAFGCDTFGNVLCGGLQLKLVWEIAFLIIGVLVLVVVPFTIFFYESFDHENDSTCKACSSALIYQLVISGLFVGIYVVCYVFLRYSSLPVTDIQAPLSSFQDCPSSAGATCSGITWSTATTPSSNSDELIKIPLPFLVFLPAFLGFLGWWLFALYLGIGLVALPIDLIRAFVYRPKYIPRDLYAHTKLEIQKKTVELLKIGEQLRAEAKEQAMKGKAESFVAKVDLRNFKRNRNGKVLFNEFKQNVLEVEEDYNDLKFCHENWKFYNPLIPWFKLACGILGAIISLLWLLHIILYNLARTPYGPDGIPTSYFLNTMFSAASKEINFALIGTLLVAIFVFWLLFCVIKGNEKFGLRFFLVEIHPMKFGGTYMNSFLVNTSLILFCIAPLVQFSASALQEYIVLTDVDAIFGQQVTFVTFFHFFFANNVFIIMMLGFGFITFIAMVCCPRDKRINQSKSLARKVEIFQQQMEDAKRCEVQDQAPNSGVSLNEEAAQPSSMAHV